MIKICIDAGHTKGYNLYNSSPAKYEGTQMYYLSLYEKKELEKYDGVTVTLTRNELTDNLDLTSRGKMAKDYDLFISNHSNAASDKNIKGVINYMDCTEGNGILADSLGKAVAEMLGSPYKGKRYWCQSYDKNGKLTENGAVYETPQKGKSNWLTVLNSAKASNCRMAFLMEQGYHSNSDDAKLLGDDEFIKKLAKAKVDIIAGYYNLKLKVPQDETKYVVVKGDTLWGIAKKFTTTVDAIAKANNIKNVNLINVGQVLIIPSGDVAYTPAVGDKVIVTGKLYSNAGGGTTIDKKDAEMYIVEVLTSNYKYPIALSKTKGGTRQGWADKAIMRKI